MTGTPRDSISIANADLGSARYLFQNGHERAGWLRLITALYFMDAAVHDLSASTPFS